MRAPATLTANAYNIFGLQGGASVSEVKRRAAHLISLAKIDEVESFPGDLGSVAAFRNEPTLKQALERLTSVKDRFAELFFWFEIQTVEDGEAFADVVAGRFQSAIEKWHASSQSGLNHIARKNLALASFIDACVNRNMNAFKVSMNAWKDIFESTQFWDFYRSHYSSSDDLGTDGSLYGEFRSSLPERLSRFTNEMYHQAHAPEVVGIYFECFGVIGRELEQNVINPQIRTIKAALDQLCEKIKVAGSKAGIAEAERLLTEFGTNILALDAFGLNTFSPMRILREMTVEKIRSATIELFNDAEITVAATCERITKFCLTLTNSDSQRALLEKDLALLGPKRELEEFLEAFMAETDGKTARAKYQVYCDWHPRVAKSIKSSSTYHTLIRQIVIEFAAQLLQSGRAELARGALGEAKESFEKGFKVLDSNLHIFDLDHKGIRGIAVKIMLEAASISDPDSLNRFDSIAQKVRETASDATEDEASQLALIFYIDHAMWKELAPYFSRLRIGQYLVNIGWWTIWIYGVGVVFWIAGFCYKRKILI